MNFREGITKFTENILPDVRDNFPQLSQLRSWETSSSEQDPQAIERVKAKFISEDQHRQLLSALQLLPPENQLLECLWFVGKQEKGSKHPHVFLVERTGEDFNLFFIDPEHNVSSKNFLRPKISNLIAMRLKPDMESSEI